MTLLNIFSDIFRQNNFKDEIAIILKKTKGYDPNLWQTQYVLQYIFSTQHSTTVNKYNGILKVDHQNPKTKVDSKNE